MDGQQFFAVFALPNFFVDVFGHIGNDAICPTQGVKVGVGLVSVANEFSEQQLVAGNALNGLDSKQSPEWSQRHIQQRADHNQKRREVLTFALRVGTRADYEFFKA